MTRPHRRRAVLIGHCSRAGDDTYGGVTDRHGWLSVLL
jgi:hypothetical protein